MSCSGFGAIAIFVTLLAALASFAALFTPLWVVNSRVDSAYNGIVSSAHTGFGVWALCVNVEFSSDMTLVHFSESTKDFSIKDCYAYYNALDRTIVRYDGQLIKDSYSTSICAHYAADGARASKSLGIMTGMTQGSMSSFLQKTCSFTGKCTLGLVIGTAVSLILACIFLVGSVCCSQNNNNCMFQLVRGLVVLAMICSCVLGILFSIQTNSLWYDKAALGASLYLNIGAFVLSLAAAYAIEKHGFVPVIVQKKILEA